MLSETVVQLVLNEHGNIEEEVYVSSFHEIQSKQKSLIARMFRGIKAQLYHLGVLCPVDKIWIAE